MKTYLIIFIIFNINILTYAQDYKTIIPEQTTHFGNNFYPVKIDSTSFINDTIFYHNFKMIRYEDYNYKLNGSSWTGKDIIILPGGYNLFINKVNDTIRINTSAYINENWLFYTFSDGRYIEAEITSKTEETFINITDSIKTISLQVKNTEGNNISHEINDMYLLLSKNHGFTRIFNFYEFPFESVSDFLYPFSAEMNITGFASYGHQNFGAKEIFDYSLNDEIHIREFHYEFDCLDPYCETIEKNIFKFTGKETSENQDTIVYTFDKCGNYQIEGELFGTWNITASDTIFLSKPENELLGNLNFEPYKIPDVDQYIITASNDTTKWVHAKFEGSDIENLNLELYNEQTVYEFNDLYYKGLGGDYFGFYTLCCIDEEIIVYAKKGETEWGNPYNCSDLTGIEENLRRNQFKIYPNPADKFVLLQKSENSLSYKIRISNISGKIIFHSNIQSDNYMLDSQKFPEGIYFIQIIMNDTMLTKKIIVKH